MVLYVSLGNTFVKINSLKIRDRISSYSSSIWVYYVYKKDRIYLKSIHIYIYCPISDEGKIALAESSSSAEGIYISQQPFHSEEDEDDQIDDDYFVEKGTERENIQILMLESIGTDVSNK